MDKETKKQVKADIASLQKLVSRFRLEKVTQEQLDEIRQAKEKLEQSAAGIL